MSRHALSAALIVALAAGLVTTAPAQRAKRKPAKPAPKAAPVVTPRQENQFVTVEEFVRARRPAGTAVSVEGYAVVAMKNGTGVKLAIVDSVDHVLNAADANKFAAGGAVAVIPSTEIKKHASWGMTQKGMYRFAMYTGTGTAQKMLHDTVAKVRVTGRAAGKQINMTGFEYADDNGDWKKL